MSSREVQISTYTKPFPRFTRPIIGGCFSVDEQRLYVNSMQNLKYLNIPSRVCFDLNLGDDTYVGKPEKADKERLDHLLEYIVLHKSTFNSNQPDFVCFRGLMTLLMKTPYEMNEPWIVLATKFNGTIYLCNQKTEQEKATRQRQTDNDRKFMRYGFKFESHVLSDEPTKPAPGSSKPVIEAEEFCAMFSTTIEGKKILYGAEMDGIAADKPCETLDELRKAPLVEVKVKRRENNERQLMNFYRFKGIKWWLQSFLVGIDAIHVGIRNDDGIVEEIQRLPIKKLSDEAKRINAWHPTVAMNFLNDFLNMVSRDLRDCDNPYLVNRYMWNPRYEIVTCDIILDTETLFLPRKFVDSMRIDH